VAITPSTQLATLTDSGGAQPASAYSATIDWGDGSGTTTDAVVFASGGSLYVGGYHRHTSIKTSTYTVSITGHGDSGSGTVLVQSTSQTLMGVADNAQQQVLTAGPGLSFSWVT
jgi:hypothetical protein